MKNWLMTISMSLLKRILPGLITKVLKNCDPIEWADALDPHIDRIMDQVDLQTKKNIVLALRLNYLFAKELYEDAQEETE